MDAKPFRTGPVLGIATAHFVHDTYTAFLPALLPLLISTLDISLVMAGTLVLAMRLPALAQPFVGHLADRGAARLLLVAAPGATAVLMSCLGLAGSYGAAMGLLFLVGTSAASFHAPATATIGSLAGAYAGRGMGLFMVGGEGGRALGPIVAVAAVSLLGLDGMWPVMAGGLLVSAVLAVQLRRAPPPPSAGDAAEPMWSSFRRLLLRLMPFLGVTAARGLVSGAMATYLPTLLTGRGESLALAGVALTIFEAAGVVGALVIGSASDYLGRLRVLAFGMGVGPLLMWAVLLADGALLVVLLVLLGLVGLAMQPVLLALVQDRFPESRGAANGIYLAMSFAGQAAGVLVVGWLGDLVGLGTALAVAAGVAFAGLPFLRALREPGTA